MTLRFCRSAGRVLLLAASAVVLPSCGSTSSPTSPSPPVAAPAPAPRSPAETYSTTTVSFSSDPGHSVGQGQSITLTSQEANFDVLMSPNQGELWVELRVKNSSPLSFWMFKVMSPNFGATRITPGTYDTARDPLSPAWFFDFGGNGRGCTATARLVIHTFELAPGTSTLQNFRASFENHHCNGSSPSMRGEIAILAPWR